MIHLWQYNPKKGKPTCSTCGEAINKTNRRGICIGTKSPEGDPDELTTEGLVATAATEAKDNEEPSAEDRDQARKASGDEVADYLDWLIDWASYGIEAKQSVVGTTGAEDAYLKRRWRQATNELRGAIDDNATSDQGDVHRARGADDGQGVSEDQGGEPPSRAESLQAVSRALGARGGTSGIADPKAGQADGHGLASSLTAAAEQRLEEAHPEDESRSPEVDDDEDYDNPPEDTGLCGECSKPYTDCECPF